MWEKGKKILSLLLLLDVINAISVFAVEKPTPLGEQVQKAKKELEKLKAETEGKRKKDAAIRKKEASILSLLEEMDHKVRVRQQEASLIELKIREKEEEMENLSSAIVQLNGEIREKKGLISQRLRMIYQERKNAVVKTLFDSRDYPNFLKRFYYLKIIAKREGEMLSLFKGRHGQLEEKGVQIIRTKRQMEYEREALAQKLVEIREERKNKNILLTRVRDERAFYEKALAELDESSLQLQAMLKKMEEERKRLQHPLPEKFSGGKGHLSWPSDGEVVGRFGRQKHAKFDTYIFRKGIEIAPSRGDEVRAVYDGSIVYANWFKGYGMVIIIDHGENYYSMYAHLSKLMVSVGERVQKNRTIGLVGETGLSKGGRLYFEIRHQGEPLDPLIWLPEKREKGDTRK